MIRVLVVDDSALMVKLLSEIINDDPDLCVVGAASHGYEAVRKIERLHPDVITMDVNMPQMDGLKAVEHIMTTIATPIIMISSLTQKGAETTIKALNLGAIDFVSKPSGYISLDIRELASEIIAKIKLASKIRVVRTVQQVNLPKSPSRTIHREAAVSQQTELDVEHILRRYVLSNVSGNAYQYESVVVIGSSTGGPQALNEILQRFPMNFAAPILIAQHMPEKFTSKLAELLDNRIELRVVEAKPGMRIRKGMVYIAQGAHHMQVFSDRTISLIQPELPLSNSPCPSINILMTSIAEVFGERSIGVLLTGMGDDGVRGMNAIKDAHGSTIAQDEETSLVFGMPKMAIESGCIDSIAPLTMIADEIMDFARNYSKK